MRKRICLSIVLLVTALTISVAAIQREQRALSEKLIRLHVVANSDSEEDQRIKLKVRDAVLEVTQGLGRETLTESLSEIEIAANDCLDSLNRPERAEVTLRKERFPTRVYDNFALPAGVYQTLRVTIGSGEGQNWWCVAFPSICLRATSAELHDAAVSAGFTEDEIKLITEDGGKYVLKFKTLELLDRIKEILFD